MEPPEIERLDERTIQQIAAGEVVERPASVVKELVENALDADASRVAVAVEAGGTEGIRVRDDGVGIAADQLEAAVAEHATSKIGTIEDLDRGVSTLGFRGEALYTIGGVSRMTVRSRPRGAETGAEVTIEGGEVGEVRPAGTPEGTTVEVSDLFYNTPARRKFLKRTATEFDHVNTVVTGYALANPDVAVSLEHDGRETFATEGNGDLRSAVLAVYGREVAESMRKVRWTPDGTEVAGIGAGDGDEPVIRVSGLVSHPETTRASREYLTTYVNGRYVTANVLREAVIDAYGGQIAPDRYPFAVLFVEVPPGDVDVNVHPRKLEVRFDREPAVRRAVETATAEALLEHGLIRSTAPRGRSAPAETAVAPERPEGETLGGAGTAHERASVERREGEADEEREADEDPTAARELSPDDADAWAVDDLSGEADPGGGEADLSGEADPGGGWGGPSDGADHGDGTGSSTSDSEEATDHLAQSATRTETERPSPRTWQDDAERGSNDDPSENTGGPSPGVTGGPETDELPPEREGPRRAPSATSQRTLGGEETSDERTYDSLPSLRVLGQLHDTYVVAEAPDGLVLIDQHAADERVNYERLRAAFADGVDSQALAAPVTVELTAREAALFADLATELESVGFRASREDERTVRVEAVPAVFDAALNPGLLRDVLSAFVGDAADGDEPVRDAVDELLADLACYPSVTGNTSLTEGSVVDLLDRLDRCENPYACPHGRPVVIRIDHDEIGDRFERDYPGHAGRRAE
ncbi:DNA mismatch repair endonuclease MutL [Halorubrum vacuolatum]|uniref:DNA mismatch repair protein MutL n=1 Tax=Halorubrum vacuolatum TaxID=63740 RepID=A0A238VKB1_HALVU|nr:DNA mismatch repair endonuclease MutL [Halorubrum vacuolatum]SNR34805.1 DNA mismatch repair protein MutL [Halorubrum vacuolatum]